MALKHEIQITEGMGLAPDGWNGVHHSYADLRGNDIDQPGFYQKFKVRLPNASFARGQDVFTRCDVAVTGRKIDWSVRSGRVRVRVTWFADDVAPVTDGGWLYLRIADQIV